MAIYRDIHVKYLLVFSSQQSLIPQSSLLEKFKFLAGTMQIHLFHLVAYKHISSLHAHCRSASPISCNLKRDELTSSRKKHIAMLILARKSSLDYIII
jgi:hypothetical protein